LIEPSRNLPKEQSKGRDDMTDNQTGSDVFFVLMGAILVFAMHGGFAFLEVGTVRHKSQVNALIKILVDFAISTVAYFVIGFWIAYGIHFFVNAQTLAGLDGGSVFLPQGFTLVKFFFLTTFAAAIPAIISGGIAERMRFLPNALRLQFWSVSSILSTKVLSGTGISVCRLSSKRHSEQNSMILPDLLSFTRWADGSRLVQ